jgi:hypothetical protein
MRCSLHMPVAITPVPWDAAAQAPSNTHELKRTTRDIGLRLAPIGQRRRLPREASLLRSAV